MIECGNFDKGVGNVGNRGEPRGNGEEERGNVGLLIKNTAAGILEELRVDFIVKHGDGAIQEVGEGILVEVGADAVNFYNSTNRPEVLFAAILKLFEEVDYLGLQDEWDRFFKDDIAAFIRKEFPEEFSEDAGGMEG